MKYQEETISNASIYAAVVYSVIDYIETVLAENHDIDEITVDERDINPENIIYKDYIIIRVYNIIDVEHKLNINVANHPITVKILPSGSSYNGLPYRALFSILSRNILRLDRFKLRELASITTRSGIEYMILYTDKGASLILEGDYLRVSIPFVRTVASIHTHPEGSCGLSKADIQSGLDLLVEGGIMEAAVTPSCAFVMMRSGAITEDDYINVKLLRDPVFKDLKLGSIIFERIYY